MWIEELGERQRTNQLLQNYIVEEDLTDSAPLLHSSSLSLFSRLQLELTRTRTLEELEIELDELELDLDELEVELEELEGASLIGWRIETLAFIL